MKRLFITLKVQDGENSHTHRILHTTPGNDIHYAANKYAATYYPDDEPERMLSWWQFFSGTIAVEVERVTELTDYEYKLMSKIFSGDKDKNNYFEIVQHGYEPGLEREELEVNLGENGKLMLYKTPEGSIVDVYNQDSEVNTMTIWEDDLSPLELEITVKTHGKEIQEFLKEWGQSHREITSNLGLHPAHNMSDEILMDDYFFLEGIKKWYPKNSSMYSDLGQAIANFLRENRDDY